MCGRLEDANQILHRPIHRRELPYPFEVLEARRERGRHGRTAAAFEHRTVVEIVTPYRAVQGEFVTGVV